MQYTLRRCKAWSSALSVTGVVVVAAVTVMMLAGGAAAADGVMLQVTDAPLKSVVMLLTQQTGTNIIIADEANLDKTVTASLTDVPLDKALDYVVKSAGVSYKQMDDGTYIIGGSLEDETVLPASDITEFIPPAVVEVAPPRESIITSIKLVHSKPSELLKLTGWTGRNPMANCEVNYPDRLGSARDESTQPSGGGAYVYTADGTRFNLKEPVRIDGGKPPVPAVDPRGYDAGAGRTADVYTGSGQVPQPSVRPPGYNPNVTARPGTTTTTGTTGTTATTTTTSTSESMLWPEGIEEAQPFDLDNSIIVKGDAEGIEKFKEIVRMLDVPPKQVEIKAEFVEVKTTDVKRFGIDWSLERLNQSFATGFGPTGNVTFGFATGNLTAQLRTQLTSDVGRIINSPIISTINNQNAYISISQEIPYWTSTTIIEDGQVITSPQVQWINIDTHLDVMPRVNGDGTITMILEPGVSDTGNVVVGPDGTEIPEERTQTLFTQRRVGNGETIVVGGFIRKNDSKSVQKVPILGDLPLIGSLFRTTANTQEDREILIFVTPRIIEDGTTGMLGGALLP